MEMVIMKRNDAVTMGHGNRPPPLGAIMTDIAHLQDNPGLLMLTILCSLSAD